jgi:UDP-glucuronate 4-epimerase
MDKTMDTKSLKKQKTQPILVTGAAGFIGYHVCNALLARGDTVVGFDNLNDYNDPRLKKKRLELLGTSKKFSFVKGSVEDTKAIMQLVKNINPRAIVHLAGEAGVRHSMQFPQSYVASNIIGTVNIFEAAKEKRIPVVYASSSSIYGERGGIFKESDRTDVPLSVYGATKKSDEVIAEVYALQYKLPIIGLRFFTVYGPWMRTDLAVFKFARLLARGASIPLYAHGKGKRSYAHVSVVVEGILASLRKIKPGHKVYNLGDERTYETKYMLALLAKELGIKPRIQLLPPQMGDVMFTRASTELARRELGVTARVPLEEGIKDFAAWFLEHKAFALRMKDKA